MPNPLGVTRIENLVLQEEFESSRPRGTNPFKGFAAAITPLEEKLGAKQPSVPARHPQRPRSRSNPEG
jgi:hypothetical protein